MATDAAGILVLARAIAKAKRAPIGTRCAYRESVLAPRHCNSTTCGYHPLRQKMKKIGLILLAGFSLLFAAPQMAAQTADPSEVFLRAYMTSQQGEKLEQEQQYAA
ncbi:MAG TPA: hypothetical protein VK993_11550, partial [Chthoniobacterales bacterium]|nr:hypothetical protein [Chthoniobacterales bacterium]